MTNEKKAEEIALKYAKEYLVSRNDSHKQNILFKESSIIECEKAALKAVANAKDEQRKWHKVAENDLPKEGGNYWCKLKGEYNQGSSHYKQHCNNGYCILQWLPKKKAWNVRYNTEVEAWIELPKYEE